MVPNFLTENEVLALRLAHRRQRDKKLADRIKSLLMLNDGFTYDEITKVLLLDEITLRRYLKKFQKKGVGGLVEPHYIGHKTRLTLLEETELKKFLQENTKRTSKEIANHILREYKVKLFCNWSY